MTTNYCLCEVIILYSCTQNCAETPYIKHHRDPGEVNE